MPTLPDHFSPHPARDASLASMEAVERGDRDGWLALFAADAIIEDPVGPSPLDPSGDGHRDPNARAAFYDTNIGPNQIVFTIADSFAAGNEVANVGRISTTMDGGFVVHTDGVFVYRVNDDGLVVSLRAFWQMDRIVTE